MAQARSRRSGQRFLRHPRAPSPSKPTALLSSAGIALSHLTPIALNYLSLPCPSFSDTDSPTSEDSETSEPQSDFRSAEILKRTSYPLGEMGRPRSAERKYSFTRKWFSKRGMLRRIKTLLLNRGWDVGFPNSLNIELDESNVTRILNDLFDESSDAALSFFFFRFSQRSNASRRGIRSTCTMIHISVLGNMNHIAMNFLRGVVRNADGGEEWHDLVFETLRETRKDREVLQTVYSMLVSCYVSEGMTDMAIKSINRMRKFGFFPTIEVYNYLLGVLLNSKQLESAWELFMEMPTCWNGSKVSTLSLFIREFCTHGCFEAAYKLLFGMPDYGAKADVVAYTIVIDALLEWGFLKEAVIMFFKMIQMEMGT